MILRLALLLAFLPSTEAKDSPAADCRLRVDILDGRQLTSGLSGLFKDTTAAVTAQDCALTCFHMKCDVAYFHSNSKTCQFTPDSSSSSLSLGCNRFVAVPTATDNGDADRVSRFCIKCSEGNPSKKPVRMLINRTAKTRNRPVKRVTVPIRPAANSSIHRLTGTWKATTRRSRPPPSRGSTIQRFIVRGPAGNFSLSRQPMRLKFGGSRHGKKTGHTRRKYPSRYFHTTSRPIRVDANRLKRKGNGIAKRKR